MNEYDIEAFLSVVQKSLNFVVFALFLFVEDQLGFICSIVVLVR